MAVLALLLASFAHTWAGLCSDGGWRLWVLSALAVLLFIWALSFLADG